jgi:hypothetical protein
MAFGWKKGSDLGVTVIELGIVDLLLLLVE